MSHKFKAFGTRKAALRYAKTALRFGFEVSPLKRGLLIAEALDAAFTLGEIAVMYYYGGYDWKGGEWYNKEGAAEWHIAPGYSCTSTKTGICGTHGGIPVGGMHTQKLVLSGTTSCASWHYCLQGIQTTPPPNPNFFLSGPTLGGPYGYQRYDIEQVTLYPKGTIVPYEPWYGPSVEVLPVPQRLDPPPSVSVESYAEPSGAGYGKRPPYTAPGFEFGPSYRGPKPHARTPPSGYKERKIKQPLNRAMRLIAKLYSDATEYKDFIDAVHDALPKKYQVKGGLLAKAKAIYDHFDELDLAKAAANLIENHYEDKAIGKLYSYGKKAPYGSQLGHPLHNPVW